MSDTTRPGPVPPPPAAQVPTAAPGWYPDTSPGVVRYWDGNTWTDHRAPAPASAPGAYYTPPAAPTFAGKAICTPGERFGAYLLDALIMLFTLYVGWLIWAAITASEGQTPGKRIMGQRVYRLETGEPATFGWMLGMRGLVGGLAFAASFYILVGFVLAFMPLWDKRNQTLVDKLSSTVVLNDPR